MHHLLPNGISQLQDVLIHVIGVLDGFDDVGSVAELVSSLRNSITQE